jgi:hypothetical protein
MRAVFSQTYVVFHREVGDRRYYGVRRAAGEHALFHAIRVFLNSHGFSVIKKRAWKDGHLLDDYQPYVRARSPRVGIPHIAIWNGLYALRGTNEAWNKEGKVILLLETDIYGTWQNSLELIRAICAVYPEKLECAA